MYTWLFSELLFLSNIYVQIYMNNTAFLSLYLFQFLVDLEDNMFPSNIISLPVWIPS
jgi:hypothetical protein